jgi:hypothetical protein
MCFSSEIGAPNAYDSSAMGVWEMQSNSLLFFRRLDPQSVLTAVYRLALVGVKLCLNVGILELSVASFANSDGGRRGLLYDPQLTLLHGCSLAHRAGRA